MFRSGQPGDCAEEDGSMKPMIRCSDLRLTIWTRENEETHRIRRYAVKECFVFRYWTDLPFPSCSLLDEESGWMSRQTVVNGLKLKGRNSEEHASGIKCVPHQPQGFPERLKVLSVRVSRHLGLQTLGTQTSSRTCIS